MKTNYYVKQLDEAVKFHKPEYNISMQVRGTNGESNYIPVPPKLFHVIRKWYKDNTN